MTVRERQRVTHGPGGSAERNGSVIGNYVDILRSSEYIKDISKSATDNDYLDILKWSSSGGTYTFHESDAAYADSYVMLWCRDNGNWMHITIDGEPSVGVAATKAAARTNPSAPYVDVPVMLLELREIAELVRDSGKELIRKAAGAHIKTQFGILPLAGDLAKLVYFQDQVERRVKVIQKLREGGYRKTAKIWSGSSRDVVTRTLNSNLFFATGVCTGMTKGRVWAHCRWLPADMSQLQTPGSMRAAARRAVLGLTSDFYTAWEIMPWSWLIDWCSTIGDYLKYQRNIIPATLQGVSVMKEHTTSWKVSGKKTNDVIQTAFELNRVSKTRRPASVTPEAHFPFLTGKQMGIVGALSVLKRKSSARFG